MPFRPKTTSRPVSGNKEKVANNYQLELMKYFLKYMTTPSHSQQWVDNDADIEIEELKKLI